MNLTTITTIYLSPDNITLTDLRGSITIPIKEWEEFKRQVDNVLVQFGHKVSE